MIASNQSTAKSIARTSLAFYIRDESRAAMRARRRSVCLVTRVPVRTRCRTRRFHRVLVRILLHRGETTWQQRRDVVANRRLRRPPGASGVKRPVAHRRAKARARVQEKRQPVARLVSGGSALRAKPNGKAGDLAGFFALADITSSNARSPAARFSRRARDTPFRLSAPRARTRSSLPGSSSGWPRSRRFPPWP